MLPCNRRHILILLGLGQCECSYRDFDKHRAMEQISKWRDSESCGSCESYQRRRNNDRYAVFFAPNPPNPYESVDSNANISPCFRSINSCWCPC